MTVADFKARIERTIEELEKVNKPLEIAVKSVNALRVKRIFVDGLNSSGGKIGSYNSTKPIYISDEEAPKRVNHKGKTGNTIKSGYYESYKAFRQDQGRESGFVNVRLTNDLQSDLSNATISKASNNVPPPNPIKVSVNEYKISLRRQVNIDKKEGLEDKYGEIFAHTKEEKEKFYEILGKEQRSIINNLMK